ncbi:ubiquinone biosynthesis O-methyltransferase, mitochondrial-like [Vespa crabro]|uniref:ubiquinone biosynthesis O-methyltransferase, mitochondrial-like n=1 Tax=Vespa crabro TaxID=7445 RepID=UPI001F028C9F|nr:ubiquinone biosynthesis O-methyltransferase, mitochondrial-like [Vespa crabro]XP_046819234.1 ubiquinone biosynthesis O-methyltransferase, mitochondrial-like [Vespa crabro]XP_046819236.1 ubiquinone biosynthesis O-methyltransferase, mitochondrial-like [Vespa crabro]XP_046819237.1 ubiquinone biosynthesis O-methyltransferase, mitochondrial-like [Vespa crabro]
MLRNLKIVMLRTVDRKFISRNNSSETPKYVTNNVRPIESTIDSKEIEFFGKLNNKWWDPNGHLALLHIMNPIRIQFIRDGLANTGIIKDDTNLPLKGTKIIDIGCGGGIFSEPLARIGAEVTGIDNSLELIDVAKEHALLDSSLSGRLNYLQTTIEEFEKENTEKYDAVVASEILEHVSNQQLFLKSCSSVIKPGGSLFITTINKTLLSWLGAIIAGEYILKYVPIGTHDWNKFISPEEVQRFLETCGLKTKLIHGIIFNPMKNEWSWSSNTSINYGLHAIKQ